jgi:nitroreductase
MQVPEVELNVFETILARRSVRSYVPQEVEPSKIRILLEAAVRAPNAMHEEPWAFVIVQDKHVLRNLSDRAKPLFMKFAKRGALSFDVFSNPDFDIFYGAGTLVLICGRVNGSFVSADCWLAAENLMLAACAMGLGTCVIGSALQVLNIPEEKERLGISTEFDAYVPIIVGYPQGDTAPVKRNKPLVLNTLSATVS